VDATHFSALITASEREENNLEGFEDFGLQQDTRQGHNLALFEPNLLDSGW